MPTARHVQAERTYKPLWSIMEDQLTRQWLRQFDPQLRLSFDLNEVEALARNKLETLEIEARTYRLLYQAGLMDLDQIGELLGNEVTDAMRLRSGAELLAKLIQAGVEESAAQTIAGIPATVDVKGKSDD